MLTEHPMGPIVGCCWDCRIRSRNQANCGAICGAFITHTDLRIGWSALFYWVIVKYCREKLAEGMGLISNLLHYEGIYKTSGSLVLPGQP